MLQSVVAFFHIPCNVMFKYRDDFFTDECVIIFKYLMSCDAKRLISIAVFVKPLHRLVEFS
jgi:hypothetical protein